MSGYVTIPFVIVLVGSLIATVTDIWKFRVYNVLTLPLVASGLIYHLAVGGTAGLGGSVLGMLLGFGSLFLFYLMGGIGAGDVKLMAGVGAWLGLEMTFQVFVISALAAGVYAVVLVLVSRRYEETFVNLYVMVHRLKSVGKYLGSEGKMESEMSRADRRKRVIPYGAMIAIGVIYSIAYYYHLSSHGMPR